MGVRAPGRAVKGPRRGAASFLALAALAASGCAAVLGIDDVNLDEGAAGGGQAATGGSPNGGEGGRGGKAGGLFGGRGGAGGRDDAGSGGVGGTGSVGGTGGVGGGGEAGVGGVFAGSGGAGGVLAGNGGAGGLVPPPKVVINEIFHNPSGADAGKCFIELFGPPNAPLAGLELRLFRANGTAVTVFVFDAEHSLGPSGFFVLAESSSTPHPEDVPLIVDNDDPTGTKSSSPNLFNSANSIALLKGQLAVDAVAYRGDEMPQQCPVFSQGEGPCAAAPLAALMFDRSISRDHLGTDTNNNQADFSLKPPTPGQHPPPALTEPW
jgi:hypothetical protein